MMLFIAYDSKQIAQQQAVVCAKFFQVVYELGAYVTLPVVFYGHIGVPLKINYDRIVRFEFLNAIAHVLQELQRLRFRPEYRVRQELPGVGSLLRVIGNHLIDEQPLYICI